VVQADQFDCDVAIVGSGISGALIGWKLAQAGAKVIMLDSGPAVDRIKGLAHAFASMASSIPEAPYFANPWAPTPSTLDPNNYLVQTGPDLFVSNCERVVGGTTWQWLGTALRLLPNDFRVQSAYGVGEDWPITYDDLEPWYLDAEKTFGVAGADGEDNGAPRSGPYPMPPFPLTYSDTQFAKAA
jgi:choline dehydrogenase-like flavoprotein